MLPDIIDKPVGLLFFGSTFHNGRIFSHTIIFLLLLLIPGLWLYWGKKSGWLLALATGVLAHLVLDQMWLNSQTLFWPLYGWGFPKYDDSDVFWAWLRILRSDPGVYVQEIMGVIILIWLATVLHLHKGLTRFLRSRK
jgi:inner membrane protein